MPRHSILRSLRVLFSLASLSALCVAFAGDAPAVPAKGKFLLFLLAGQSNMSGRGYVKELSAAEKAPDSRVLALNKDGDWQPAADPLHWDKPGAAGVGIGKFFGRIVADETPGVTVGLIPTACGGSPIGDWAPGKFFAQTKSHPYDDALVRARRAMKDGTLKAILWHQGESDSTPKAAALYAEKLEELITRFRTDLDAPDLPFIIGQLGRFEARPWTPARAEVDQAQRAVAAKMKNVYFVSSDGLVSRGDNLHFNTASLRILARRYADAYLAQAKK